MKRFLCIFMALSVMVSTMIFTTNTATAATVDVNSVATDVDIWNHEFKNDISGEVIWAIDELEDDDTLAVSIQLYAFSVERDTLEEFAKKNNRTDELIYKEEGELVDAGEELWKDYMDYVDECISKAVVAEREKVLENYCISEFHYSSLVNTMFCVATKEQVIRLADADIAVSIDLANKDYYDATNKITWDEYRNIKANSIKFIEENYQAYYNEEDSDVLLYCNVVNNLDVIFVSNDNIPADIKLVRDGEIRYIRYTGGTEILLYDEGKVKNLSQMYREGRLNDYEFDQLGGTYYCDVNGDQIADVKDVTELQLLIAGIYDENDYFNKLINLYSDLNEDGYVDVKDVTQAQLYLAGYDV